MANVIPMKVSLLDRIGTGLVFLQPKDIHICDSELGSGSGTNKFCCFSL